jgi:transposase
MKSYIGIDWSQCKHDICFLNDAGSILKQSVIQHSQTGFEELDRLRTQMGVPPSDCLIGLETANSILVDFLWDQGYTQIFVLSPNLVKGSRTRFRNSGAKDDPQDARLIADILRTDQNRLQCWKPDSSLTRQIRKKVSFIHFLTINIVRMTNRQRAVLRRYHPAAIDLFSGLKTQIAQHFILEFPTPQATNSLDLVTFRSFAKHHHYTHPHKLAGILAKLETPYPQADLGIVEACQGEAQGLARLLLEMIQLKLVNLKELQKLLDQHPDRDIYASLPGTSVYLQAGLISKFGDDRQRFPSTSRVQALAGTSPITVSSGKRKYVRFRRSCDHEFRHIAQQWAKLSLRSSVWANVYYSNVRPKCNSESHAFRCLANRWLAILWRLWQDETVYNEVYHMHQRAIKSKPVN